MKILHVVLSMDVGGAQQLVYNMVRHPAFAAAAPAVCCLDAVGELGERLRQAGYEVYCKNRRGGLDWSVVPWLHRIIRSERATIVHAHQYTPMVYAVPAARLVPAVRVVYTEHGRSYPEKHSWKRRLANPWLSRGIDHLVSICASTAQDMAAVDNLPLRRIRVIHNGVDCAPTRSAEDLALKRSELGLSASCRLVGTAARLDESKNLPMLLRAFRDVSHAEPDAYLLVAGQGPQRDHLEYLAEQLGITCRTRFLGLRLDMAQIYPLLDVFVLSSHTEGISLALLEAMTNAVPAVVTNVGGNPEVVQETTGHLVEAGSAQAMAQRIVELLRQPSRARQLGAAARERAHAAFSFEVMLRAYRNDCYTA